MTAAIENKAPATSGQLATFRLDGDLYGVEVEHVQEVLRSQQLTRVPLAPSAVAARLQDAGAKVVVEAANRELQHLSTLSQKQVSFITSVYYIQTWSEQSA